MHRRSFLQLAAGALAAPALACGPRPSPATAAAQPARPIDAAAFHALRRFADLPCGKVAYIERGTGDAALFIHGFPLSSFQWRGAFDRLAGVRRCVAPDLLASGFTEVADGQSVAPDAQVAMLVALLDALAIRSADVVANDSGSAFAQLLATRHPDRVRSLLLTNGDVEPDCPPRALAPLIELAHAGTFPDRMFVPLVRDKTYARSKDALGAVYTFPTNPTDEAIDCYIAPLVSSPRRKQLMNQYAIGLERNALAGIEPALRALRIPVRVVWGTGDDLFAATNPDYLDRTVGNSRGIRRVPGAKLFFPEEFPDLIAEEARALWGV
jgi:pimeloyl-ACP methyl ester carboxylesterase